MSETTDLVLPRVIPDTHCDSQAAALKEMRRRRAQVTPSALTRIQKSPYGGYVVVSLPLRAVVRAIRTAGGRVLVRGTHGYGEAYIDE